MIETYYWYLFLFLTHTFLTIKNEQIQTPQVLFSFLTIQIPPPSPIYILLPLLSNYILLKRFQYSHPKNIKKLTNCFQIFILTKLFWYSSLQKFQNCCKISILTKLFQNPYTNQTISIDFHQKMSKPSANCFLIIFSIKLF